MSARGKPAQEGTTLAGPILIDKNTREKLRLCIDEYLGHRLLSARVWFKPDDGSALRPGVGGWAITLDRLADIIASLQQLEAEGRRLGLLP